MDIEQEILSSVPFRYADDVKNGRIVTGNKIKLAVERFYSWVEDNEKNYILDHAAGMHCISFFHEFLKHTKGEFGGQPFILSHYQQFTLYNIFAWKKHNNKGQLVRVIKTVYEKVARKNGKTAILAGIGLYCQAFDEEQAAEIYVGATKEEQAKVCWTQAVQYVIKSPLLKELGFTTTQREVRLIQFLATFKFLGGDSKSLDGLNPSVSIIDEYHAHPNDSIREVLESAMGARKQPIIYIITTAGTVVTSVCKQYEDVCNEILQGDKEDDSTFIMIHDLDDADDWEDPENWIKANPNLGISINMDYLMSEYTKAKNQPSKAPNFKTKHLNKWVDAPEIWIPSEIWKRNKVDSIPLDKFKKHGAYAAIDLSTTIDITALVILSEPDEEDNRYLLPYFFCPKGTIDARSKHDRVPYRDWMDRKLLIATPGDTVDYEKVKDTAKKAYYELSVLRIEMDQWNAHQMANDFEEMGIEVSFFSQSISSISFPTKQFEKLVYEGKIKHDGNPILTWMLAGCSIYEDANENIKVHKGRSHMGKKRVDGIVATIMALGGSLSIDESDESKYNSMVIEENINEE